jgi:hypothetical protein
MRREGQHKRERERERESERERERERERAGRGNLLVGDKSFFDEVVCLAHRQNVGLHPACKKRKKEHESGEAAGASEVVMAHMVATKSPGC